MSKSGMLEQINHFVTRMADSQNVFEKNMKSVNEKSQLINQSISKMRGQIQNLSVVSSKSEDKWLEGLCEGAKNTLQNLLVNVTEQMDNTQKGINFIETYEKSFNIAVFGKVKAGKSYLGNFVMGNAIRDLGLKTAYDQLERPKVEVYDRGKHTVQDKLSEIDQNGNESFFVDPNEATSAIQLFHLGGLTWFDTPGIGSVTWENEMLAKDYVINADLVVYTSNSDAAGTQQDFVEMKELYHRGKRFLLLLTQSDTVEEDVDDKGEIISALVAKSEKDRHDTEQYMIDTLRKEGLTNFNQENILTISCKLGMFALENGDEACFSDSHMGDFLDKLCEITTTEGAQLKLRTPIIRINAAVDKLINLLTQSREVLQKYEIDLVEKQKKMREEQRNLKISLEAKCSERISGIIAKRSHEIEENGETISAESLNQELSHEVLKIITSECLAEFAQSDQILNNYADKLKIEAGSLKIRQDTIEYTLQRVTQVKRDPEGLMEHIGSFIFNKTYYRPAIREEKKQSKVDIGVNQSQINGLAQAALKRIFEDEVPNVLDILLKNYFKSVHELLQSAYNCVDQTIDSLRSIKC